MFSVADNNNELLLTTYLVYVFHIYIYLQQGHHRVRHPEEWNSTSNHSTSAWLQNNIVAHVIYLFI